MRLRLLTWELFYFQFNSRAVELFVSHTAGLPNRCCHVHEFNSIC